jgi:hypothetical protein
MLMKRLAAGALRRRWMWMIRRVRGLGEQMGRSRKRRRPHLPLVSALLGGVCGCT